MPVVVSSIFRWLVSAALWVWLCFHLHYEWTLNPQYQYGWAVPFLAAFLFYQRWTNRPSRRSSSAFRGGSLFLWSLLFLLLPLRAIEEANPDWRLVSWTLGLVVVTYTLVSLAEIGGREWAGHFAFPVCFALVAVPWPVQLENVVVQNMTRAVAYAAVEIAGWIGVGAFQIGNVIELHNGFVGVNEACSGVKTLQAAIMVALVLGELLLLPVRRRFALLVAGCVWVFACNVMRATVLVIIASKEGTAALEKWHDLIGTVVVVVGMAGLLGIAWLLRAKDAGDQGVGARPVAPDSKRSVVIPLVRLAWLVLVFGATEAWYRSHERQLIELPPWRVRWPENLTASQAIAIPEETRAILRYNEAQSAAWEAPPAVRWWGFFARWEPQRAALGLVRSHSPEICLPAVGRTFRGELPSASCETGAGSLQFRVYEFEQNHRPLYVFVCIQEDKTSGADEITPSAEWSARGRIRAVWLGQRNLGQRLLEIAVVGFDDFAQARAAVAKTVGEIVVRAGVTG